jgi:hypothetical protein
VLIKDRAIDCVPVPGSCVRLDGEAEWRLAAGVQLEHVSTQHERAACVDADELVSEKVPATGTLRSRDRSSAQSPASVSTTHSVVCRRSGCPLRTVNEPPRARRPGSAIARGLRRRSRGRAARGGSGAT